MDARIRRAIQLLRGTVRGRDIEVRMHDLFLVSYPKSVNTWLRFILANLMHPDMSVTFSNIEQLAPDIYQHSSNELKGVRDPRALKSHEYFDPRYKKVIYIVRDPRA